MYSEEMLTSENIGLASIEKPIKPGIRKSMYLFVENPRLLKLFR